MKKVNLILIGLLCLIGTASAMGSTELRFELECDGRRWWISRPHLPISMGSTVGQITGLSTSTYYKLQVGFWVMDDTLVDQRFVPLPGYANPPTDPDGDCIYEDLNANGRKDFNDVVLISTR